MAKVCYITNNRIEKEHIGVKNGEQVVENTAIAFKLYETYDALEIEEIKADLEEKNKSRNVQVTITVIGGILAIKRVRLDKNELIKIIVYEDAYAENIRDVFYADTLSVKETVTEVVKMGIGLVRSDIKDLVNIIEKAYRRLDIVDDGEELGRTYWLKDIARMCLQEIEGCINIRKENSKAQEQVETIGIITDETGKEKYAYMKVKDFSKWYDETDYRKKLSVYTVREEFRNAGVTVCNPGRTEYTRSIDEGENGKCPRKVVEFEIEKLREYCK